MNKWRLLLFSVFALLHITTSERNFIDGRYESCNHSPRFSSDTRLCTYDNYRVKRYFPEIRQLKTPDNYRDSEERVPEFTKVFRGRQIEYRERRSRDYLLPDDDRRVIIRQRSKILTSTPIDNPGGQYYRERIDERTNDLRTDALRTDARLERFVRQLEKKYEKDTRTLFLSRNDNRPNDATRNRFERRDLNSYNHNDRETRNTPENRLERKEKRYSNRNVISDAFDNMLDSEGNIFPSKSILIMRADREQPERRTRSDSINVNDKLENHNEKRNLRGTHGVFTRESETRIGLASRYFKSQDRINSNVNKVRLVRNNQLPKRGVRNFEDSNSMAENRRRSTERDVERRVNEMRNDARSYEFQALHKISTQQREYNEQRFERDTRAHNDRRSSFDRNLEINSKKQTYDRRVSEKVDLVRGIRDENRISFESSYVRSPNRINSNVNKRRLVRNSQLNRRVRNIEDSNSLVENRQKSTQRDVERRIINEVRGDADGYEFQALRKSSTQHRNHNEHTFERDTRAYNDRRRSFDRNLQIKSKRENFERNVSEEVDLVRGVRVEAQIKLNKRNVIYTIRGETESSERDNRARSSSSKRISGNRDVRLIVERERNFENIVSRPCMERNRRVYTFQSRKLNNYRYSERNEIRDNHNEKGSDTRRDNTVRGFERNHKRTDRTSRYSPASEYTVRVELLRSYEDQRTVNENYERGSRRTRQTINISQETRERDVSRRDSRRLSKDARSRDRLGSDENTERGRYDVRQESNLNRISSRISRNDMTTRSELRRVMDNTNFRSLTPEERVTIGRHIRNTRESTRQNIVGERRIQFIYDRDSSRTEFSDLESSIQKRTIESEVFGIKWQYLFYALQAVYLCSLLMKIPNGGGKQKIRLSNWFAFSEYFKID